MPQCPKNVGEESIEISNVERRVGYDNLLLLEQLLALIKTKD